MKNVYVDNNATTAIAPEVLAAMQPYLTSDYFNPSSMYDAARSSAEAIESARRTIACCLGDIDPDQIIFTGSATESNNAALSSPPRLNTLRYWRSARNWNAVVRRSPFCRWIATANWCSMNTSGRCAA